jgi:membrane-bound lytic murein transglycosylase D
MAPVVVGVCVAAAVRPAAAAVGSLDEFPTPPALAPAVRFWIDVFTRYSTEDAIIHDRVTPGAVYRIVRVGHGPAGTAHVAAEVRALGDRLALASLFAGPAANRFLVPDVPADPPGLERLRVQRGLRPAIAVALAGHRLYAPTIQRALAAEGLPPALAALPLIESSYRPDAESEAGAAGLWQLMPDIAREYEVSDRRDPALASGAAARYLRALHESLGSWPLALTAYNRGLAGVERARRRVGSDDLGVIVQRYRGDRFGFCARNFYAKFLAARHVLRHRATYFPEAARDRIVEYKVRAGDTLDRVARRHGVSVGSVRTTNALRSALLMPGQRILIRL